MSHVVTGQRVIDWVTDFAPEFGNYGAAVGIGLEKGGDLIAGVVFNEYNGPNINMHVAAMPGSRWLDREYLWYCFYYPFEQLKVKRVTGLVGEGNAKSRRFTEHLGFELEAKLKDAHPTGAMLVYVLRRENCKWLHIRRLKHDHQKQQLLGS